MQSSLSLLIFIFLSISLPLFTSSQKGFSIDLIHRDSPSSPFYNPNHNSSDRLHASVRRSIARATHLTNNNIQSTIASVGGEYLMSVNIGNPPTKVMAIADTGSDLTWTQCRPCHHCYSQNAPIYNSLSSTTHSPLSCNSPRCSQILEGRCDTSSKCKYTYSYGDNSSTTGFLSSDTFFIGSTPVPNIIFGCSHDSRGTFDSRAAGIIGLGAGQLSLISQLGPLVDYKFSYCMVPSGSDAVSKINFGENANVGPHAAVTPLARGKVKTYYTVTLEAISVAGEKVEAVGRKDGHGEGNMIVDSGTTLTFLNKGMLKMLRKKVVKAVKKYPRTWFYGKKFEPCYDITGVDNAAEMPDITFHFTGANVTLKPLNTFVEAAKNVLCLGFAQSSSFLGGLQVFGNLAQQNMHVGYDLKNRKLAFAPADCAKM